MAFEDGKYVIAMDEDFANKLKDPEEEAIGDSLLDTDELESKIKELTAGNNSKLELQLTEDRKSTRLNSSHEWISNAVYC